MPRAGTGSLSTATILASTALVLGRPGIDDDRSALAGNRVLGLFSWSVVDRSGQRYGHGFSGWPCVYLPLPLSCTYIHLVFLIRIFLCHCILWSIGYVLDNCLMHSVI